MKKTNKIISILLIICFTLSLIACEDTSASTTGITALTISKIYNYSFFSEDVYSGVIYDELRLDVVASDTFDINDIKVVISDPNIIDISYDVVKQNSLLHVEYSVSCLKPGAVDFHFETSDSVIKSEVVSLNVKQNIKSIKLDNTTDIVLHEGDEPETIFFSMTTKKSADNEEKLIQFVSENEDVVSFNYKDSSFWGRTATIQIVGAGETYIYIQTEDGTIKTDKIKVTVEKYEEETSEEPDTNTLTNLDTDTDTGIEAKEESEVTEEQKSGIIVYTTPTGSKYHYSRACAGKNAIEHDLDDVSGSYGPCKKCA